MFCILFFFGEIVYDRVTSRNILSTGILGRGIVMAKKFKFKPTPAGIMFLAAIGVLLIAIIILTIVGVSRCKKDPSRANDPSASASEAPVESAEPSPEPVESTEPTEDPDATTDPDATIDPDATPDSDATPEAGDSSMPPIVITTPGSATSSLEPGATPTATPNPYYTTPTSTMKKNAQKGYVSADSVRMRKGPGTKFDIVTEKIAKNTAVTLYVEQEGWWFLKCGDKYGYIKGDYIAKGTAPATAAAGEQTGKVIVSKIALRKSADSKSECIKEYENGETVTIMSSAKDSSGKTWYYVKTSDGKKGYMYAEYIKVNKK